MKGFVLVNVKMSKSIYYVRQCLNYYKVIANNRTATQTISCVLWAVWEWGSKKTC